VVKKPFSRTIKKVIKILEGLNVKINDIVIKNLGGLSKNSHKILKNSNK